MWRESIVDRSARVRRFIERVRPALLCTLVLAAALCSLLPRAHAQTVEVVPTGILPPTEHGRARVVLRALSNGTPLSDAPLLTVGFRSANSALDLRADPLQTLPFTTAREQTTLLLVIDPTVSALKSGAFARALFVQLFDSGGLRRGDALGLLLINQRATSLNDADFFPPQVSADGNFSDQIQWLNNHIDGRATHSPIYGALLEVGRYTASLAGTSTLPARREILVITDAQSEDFGQRPSTSSEIDGLIAEIRQTVLPQGVPVSGLLINTAGSSAQEDLTRNTKFQELVRSTNGTFASVVRRDHSGDDALRAETARQAGAIAARIQSAFVLEVDCWQEDPPTGADQVTLSLRVHGQGATPTTPGDITRGTADSTIPAQWVRCLEQEALCAALGTCSGSSTPAPTAPIDPTAGGGTPPPPPPLDPDPNEGSATPLTPPIPPPPPVDPATNTDPEPTNAWMWILGALVAACLIGAAWLLFGGRNEDDEPAAPVNANDNPWEVEGTTPPRPYDETASPGLQDDTAPPGPYDQATPRPSASPASDGAVAVTVPVFADPPVETVNEESTKATDVVVDREREIPAPVSASPRGPAPAEIPPPSDPVARPPSPTAQLRSTWSRQLGACLAWLQGGQLTEYRLQSGERFLVPADRGGWREAPGAGNPDTVRITWDTGGDGAVTIAPGAQSCAVTIDGVPLTARRALHPGCVIASPSTAPMELRWLLDRPGPLHAGSRSDHWLLECITDSALTPAPLRIEGAPRVVGRAPAPLDADDIAVALASTSAESKVGRISGTHARFWTSGGVLYVRDLGSSNGVHAPARGERIDADTPRALADGDEVWFSLHIGFRVRRA